MIKEITCQGERLALIIFHPFQSEGVQFLTPGDASFQVAYMKHPTGKWVEPHLHNQIERSITHTQEVFIIKRGKVRVDFYNNAQMYLESQILVAGDLLLQVSGGHSFEVLEELEMIEVKQGPYLGANDKTYFAPAAVSQNGYTKQYA